MSALNRSEGFVAPMSSFCEDEGYCAALGQGMGVCAASEGLVRWLPDGRQVLLKADGSTHITEKKPFFALGELLAKGGSYAWGKVTWLASSAESSLTRVFAGIIPAARAEEIQPGTESACPISSCSDEFNKGVTSSPCAIEFLRECPCWKEMEFKGLRVALKDGTLVPREKFYALFREIQKLRETDPRAFRALWQGGKIPGKSEFAQALADDCRGQVSPEGHEEHFFGTDKELGRKVFSSVASAINEEYALRAKRKIGSAPSSSLCRGFIGPGGELAKKSIGTIGRLTRDSSPEEFMERCNKLAKRYGVGQPRMAVVFGDVPNGPIRLGSTKEWENAKFIIATMMSDEYREAHPVEVYVYDGEKYTVFWWSQTVCE
jgi:hypothetical protein